MTTVQHTTSKFLLLQSNKTGVSLLCATQATWRHLLFLANGVIPGELHPLVRLNARHAQKLHALHAVTCRLCVVVAAHAHLPRTKIKNKWKEKTRESGVTKTRLLRDERLRVGKRWPTWLVFSTVLLGTSAESLTKKLSNTSISQHSCLHTGHRMAPTGARDHIHYWRCQLTTTYMTLLFQTHRAGWQL